MKVRKLRKKLSKRMMYKVGINGDFVGTFSKYDMKKFDNLKVVMICLDLQEEKNV